MPQLVTTVLSPALERSLIRHQQGVYALRTTLISSSPLRPPFGCPWSCISYIFLYIFTRLSSETQSNPTFLGVEFLIRSRAHGRHPHKAVYKVHGIHFLIHNYLI